MVAVPETAGVHWKTSSGELPELPQLPACELAPLVVPPKVPPWAGITVGLLQAPDPASVVVVVEVVVGGLVVVVVVLVVGGVAGMKVASTMNQLLVLPSARLPCCGPAALDRMSSRSEAALPFCTSSRYGTIWLLPAVAQPGWLPVMTAATTSSPAGTGAVGPALA